MIDRKTFLKGIAAGGVAVVGVGRAGAHEIHRAKPVWGKVTVEGRPKAGVVVSDGLNCVLTGTDGSYKLPANPRVRFVFVTIPAGFRTKKRYIRYSSSKRPYNFELTPWKPSAHDGFKIMHIGDSEIGADLTKERNWVERAKKLADRENVAFWVHTGDITMQLGDLHRELMNDEVCGRPVFYVLGNHDVIWEERGETLFEENFGPCWYSFDCGTTHFIVTPMMWGDGNPSYTVDEIVSWLRNDLAIAKQRGQGVILLTHGCYDTKIYDARHIFDETRFVTYGSQPLDLMTACDFHGVIHGHLHTNYFRRSADRRLEVVSVAPPAMQLSTLQVITVDADHRMHVFNQYGDYEWPDVAEPKECVWKSGVGSIVLFCPPAVEGDNVYVNTLDFCGKDAAGIYCLDRISGRRKWFYRTQTQLPARVLACKGRVYAADEDWIIYCLDGETGQEVWKTDARQSIGAIGAVFGGGGSSQLKTAITIDDQRGWIFVGTIKRNLFAVDMATGREVWHAKDRKTFFLETASAPVVCGDTVFASGFWMGRYGYDIATGRELWRHTRNNSTVTSEWYASGIPWIEAIGFPKFHEGKVYIATHSHFLEVNPRTGELLREKKFPFSLNCYTEPLILGRRAYFGSPRNGLICFDLDRFEMVWASPVENALLVQLPYEASPMKCLSSIPVLWRGNIWATAADGAIYCWDKDTGTRLRRLETGVPFIASCTVGPDDRLYTADFSGNVRCFDV